MYNLYHVKVSFYSDLDDEIKIDTGYIVGQSHAEIAEYLSDQIYSYIKDITIEEILWDCSRFVLIPEGHDYLKKVLKDANEY